MGFFIHNLSVFSCAFASLYFSGLGPSLILLPKQQQQHSFIFAPLISICFLTLVGLFQITVLLVPFTPRANICILLIISLCICLGFCRTDLRKAWVKFRITLSWLWFLPILLVFVFSWMFHNGGLHLLVGGSDQLQYCENARQILEEMHTGSSLDMPVARQDHFVYEMNTRILPYYKGYRRGAELMLATTTAITGLSYYAAFPVTVLNTLLALSLVIGLIGRFFLRLSRQYALLLQLIFISSFYFLLIHVQGSLAVIMGIPTGLTTLAFLSRITSQSTWQNLVLTAIMMATYFSIYAEPALINVMMPTVALLVWYLVKDKLGFFKMLRNISLIYLLVFALAPFAVSTVFAHAVGNFSLLTSPYINGVSDTTTSISVIQKFLSSFSMQTWEVAGAVLGFMSYYNVGNFHLVMKFLFIKHPVFALIGFMLFSGCGLLGCLKSKKTLAYLYSIPLVCWLLTSVVTANQHDDYRFARSLHYAMPFAMVGIVLLVSRYRWFHHVSFNMSKLSLAFTKPAVNLWGVGWQSRGATHFTFWKGSIKICVTIILAVFIILNIYTTIRTVRFIASHNNDNDPILLRFNEQNSEWQLLRKELQYSALHHVPVLISSFQETVRPFAISIIMRTQTHILGKSILSFWKLYDITDPAIKPISPSASELSLRYNTRLQESELFNFQQRENQPWHEIEERLVNNSEQAVVALNNNYPIEWLATKDVFPAKIKHFSNICNVVYRYRYTVTLPATMIAPLKHDKHGAFRKLLSSGPVIVNGKVTAPQILTLSYDGRINDVKLHVGHKLYVGKNVGFTSHVTIVAVVDPKDKSLLRLDVVDIVKLRSISWEPKVG